MARVPLNDAERSLFEAELGHLAAIRDYLAAYDPKDGEAFPSMLRAAMELTGSYQKTGWVLNVTQDAVFKWLRREPPTAGRRSQIQKALVRHLDKVVAAKKKYGQPDFFANL
jgi:hypothetical protein